MARTVRVGVYLPQVSATFDPVLDVALRVEAAGLDAFWLYDHLYTPMLPAHPALEGWTLATALLARTTSLRVGHLVLNNNLRHPAVLAKMVATLDVIAGGRFELGLGSGSYEAEHHEAGLPWGSFRERTERLEESLQVVLGMLTDEVTTFEGRHVQVRDLPNRPGPVQRPHPRVHLGGVGLRHTLPLVARYADVYNIPVYGLDRTAALLAALDERCREVGRDPATITRSHQAVLALGADGPGAAAARALADRHYPGPGWGLEQGGYAGTPAEVVDRIGRWVEQGITEFAFLPADRGRGEVIELLGAEVLPQLP